MRPRVVSLVLLWSLSVPPVQTQSPLITEVPDATSVGLLEDCGFLLTMKAADTSDIEKVSRAMRCFWYVNGMIAMNAMYQGLILEPNARDRQHSIGFFCMPKEGIQTMEAVAIVAKHLMDLPLTDLSRTTRRLAIIQALARAYPCEEGAGAMARSNMALNPLKRERRIIRIHITITGASTTNFVTRQKRDLADTVGDLRSAIGFIGRRSLQSVKTNEKPDMTVEITSRQELAGGTGGTFAGGVGVEKGKRKRSVEARILVGEKEFPISSADATWNGAAEGLARQLVDFARDNYDLIISSN